MDQGNYSNEKKRESISHQGRYGENDSSAEAKTWICPECETLNVENHCTVCGTQRPASKVNTYINTNSSRRKKLGWKIIAASIAAVLISVISVWTISSVVEIKHLTEIAAENAVLVFHQDKTNCVVKIEVYPIDVYTKAKGDDLHMYYTLGYEDNKITEICRFSPDNEELSRHLFSYEDGAVYSQKINTLDHNRDYTVLESHRCLYGYSLNGTIFEETYYCWDSFSFSVQDGAMLPLFDVRINRNGSIEGYILYKDSENQQYYSDKLQLVDTQVFQGIVDIEYNTDETFKPRYIFRDESGKEILPESFEVFGESHDYDMPCISCAKISDQIIYISMFRDLELFGIAEKVSATVQFHYIDNSEPSERIRVDVGNRENNSILEMVVDMSYAENWSLENVQKIALHISGPRATMDSYISLNVAN